MAISRNDLKIITNQTFQQLIDNVFIQVINALLYNQTYFESNTLI